MATIEIPSATTGENKENILSDVPQMNDSPLAESPDQGAKPFLDTSRPTSTHASEDSDELIKTGRSSSVSSNDADFNAIPSLEVVKRVGNFTVFDKDGKSRPFKSLYTGPNVPRRVLVIFIRNFLCGNCQGYIHTLTSNIKPDELLQLPVPSFIAIVGCGDPSLIETYHQVTNCPFPIYTDPTQRLFDELGMMRTLAIGKRPDYQRRALVSVIAQSLGQGLKLLPSGKALKSGDRKQVGGEFLFEPLSLHTPVSSPIVEADKQVGVAETKSDNLSAGNEEEKQITWCHRMRYTRDHAEIPELREILGLDGAGDNPGKHKKRWSKAMTERKGSGTSWITGVTGNKAQDCGCD